MDKRKGFTLIELVIVIVILGILAAFVVPRFANLTKEARQSAVSAMAGSLRSAAAIAHSVALTQGKDCTSTTVDTIAMDGNSAVTIIHCYPTADAAGIGSALGSTDGYTASGGGATPGATITYTKNGANTACTATYKAASNSSDAPVVTDNAPSCN